MTPTETAAKLRNYNLWRRGNLEGMPQPDPREIGEAIDAAIEMIERLEAAEKAVTEAYQRGYATGQEEIEKEHDELRARIEEMEQQVPLCRAEDLRHAEILLPALGLMPEDKLYALPGAQPAPSVPDGFVWPECPKRRQSHVLFDDGYEEGWAKCVATMKEMLAAAPEAKP